VNGRPLDEVALAVFDGPTHALQLANAAWRALLGAQRFPARPPDTVFRSGAASQLAELGLRVEADREVYLRVAIEPVRDKLGQIAGVIVVCTTSRIASSHARLDVDPDALVWGGPTDRGPDYSTVDGAASPGHGRRVAGGDPATISRAAPKRSSRPRGSAYRLTSRLDPARHRRRLLARVRVTFRVPAVRQCGRRPRHAHRRGPSARGSSVESAPRVPMPSKRIALNDQFLAAVSTSCARR